MTEQEKDILIYLSSDSFINQRILAENIGHSLGITNSSLKKLQNEGYLSDTMSLTIKADKLLQRCSPRNAIILAAGYGMRMVPINTETPKGLLEIDGEPIIERQIQFLHEVGINEIYIVVGFMKEQYDYLTDKYGVELIVNNEYSTKNNLHSLSLAKKYLNNTYIIPCDVYCFKNPFRQHEIYSWYMVSDLVDDESWVRMNRKKELVKIGKENAGNAMIGIAYLTQDIAKIVEARLKRLDCERQYDSSFWETVLFEKDKMIIPARIACSSDIVEITTYEQLRELDEHSSQLKTEAMDTVVTALGVSYEEIINISILKKGMTNRSFLFDCYDNRYIMRIPGEGTDKLINRKQEYDVYQVIKEYDICDEIVYINPQNGYKITKYLHNARTCNPDNMDDVQKCMKKLREFHSLQLKVDHTFDLFAQIEFYESLWNGEKSYFKDYEVTKQHVMELKQYIEKQDKCWVLTHIDAVPDNFLFVSDKTAEEIRLIDWEYAGMQDSCVDIAMFAIYAMYDRMQVEQLIDAYYEEGCSKSVRMKIYCYISICGLLWSNWCEYKRQLGIEFGEYSLRQYRYAKDYYKIFLEELKNE